LPGGVLISEKVYSEVEGKLDVGFEDRGEQQLKNISKPVRAYAVRAREQATVTNSDVPEKVSDKPTSSGSLGRLHPRGLRKYSQTVREKLSEKKAQGQLDVVTADSLIADQRWWLPWCPRRLRWSGAARCWLAWRRFGCSGWLG
jgi:hypothetical protein